MLTIVGTLAFDTLGIVRALASPEQTGGVKHLVPDALGGTAGNVCMALARLGSPPRIVGSVGPEFAASPYATALREAGIDTSGLHVGKLPTARAYVFSDEHGRQMTYFYPGASGEFQVEPETLAGQRAHFCAGEIARYPPLMQAASFVSFDPGQELFHRPFDEIEACLPHVDTLFANRHELAVIEKKGWTLDRVFEAGATTIVETRGASGTIVHTPGGRFAAPAPPARSVDPTGAGDAHRAGFLFATERGASLGVAARFANVLGSFAIEQVGAQAGLASLKQAVERYQKTFNETPW